MSTPMSEVPFDFNTDHETPVLRCPACAGDYVHLDDTYVAGRSREDGPIKFVHIDSGGNLQDASEKSTPLPKTGLGRRHAIALAGWCEGCNTNLAIVFQQHKGQTQVTVLNQKWETLTARPF